MSWWERSLGDSTQKLKIFLAKIQAVFPALEQRHAWPVLGLPGPPSPSLRYPTSLTFLHILLEFQLPLVSTGWLKEFPAKQCELPSAQKGTHLDGWRNSSNYQDLSSIFAPCRTSTFLHMQKGTSSLGCRNSSNNQYLSYISAPQGRITSLFCIEKGTPLLAYRNG